MNNNKNEQLTLNISIPSLFICGSFSFKIATIFPLLSMATAPDTNPSSVNIFLHLNMRFIAITDLLFALMYFEKWRRYDNAHEKQDCSTIAFRNKHSYG